MIENDLRTAAYWVGGILVLFVLAFIPYTTTGTEVASVPFTTSTSADNSLELGETDVKVSGLDGQKTVTNRATGTFLQRILFADTVDKEEIESVTTRMPVDKQVAEGTKKYQYMYCSDNTYRYYTDEQFSNPQVGFTSKSEDFCQTTGHGSKLRLADSPTVARPRCIDVTSYDYNWNNDMLCYNPDGSSYYTSYAGAGL